MEEERLVRVRALTGESVSLPLTVDCTVAEFKGLLRQTFPVANRYPNFNLYHKGVKLSLQRRISCYSIGPDDVIGLIPVIKKQTESHISDRPDHSNSNDIPTSSGFADLAWSNIMQEMHEISTSRENTQKDPGSASSDVGSKGSQERVKSSLCTKRRRSDDFEKIGFQSSASNEMKRCSFSANGENMNVESSRSVSTTKLGRKLCHYAEPLSPVEMVEHLRHGLGSQQQIVHIQEIAGRKPVYMDIPNAVLKNTRHALEQIGVMKLYSHQAKSIQLSLLRKNVIVATLTSSGKSLCYNVPVLEELFKDPLSCSLYLFPTKALSQDQLKALKHMTQGFDVSSQIGIYDGDTLQGDRTWMRDNARLLITNPDMLHKSILHYHGRFERILSNLRFVVIDEAHAYKGAFGCHTALILRRLRRLCSHVYGSDPTFIFSTATSANPSQHCMELANLESIELVENDGSPAAKKLFVLWNSSRSPQTVQPENWSSAHAYKPPYKGSSPIWEVSCLFAEMVQHGLKCIAFCPSRRLCELVLSYTRDILRETAPNLVDSITSYRAGYASEVRRATENDFSGGKLRGLAATNALELGIDVGHLDVTLHLGFPGSIASLWQQAGRSGRRERPSLAVYVAFGGPLDQYFMKHPDKLFGSPIECSSVDAQNPQVLEQHLTCAAAEHPLSLRYDEKFFGSGLEKAMISLKKKGCLSCDVSRDPSARTWDYIGHEKKPSDIVNIRAIENVTYDVIDSKNNAVLEKIEESKAFFQIHEGAVYMQQGKTYLVKDLDLSAKIAWCQEADLKYYTKTRDYTDIKVTGGDIACSYELWQKNLTSDISKAYTLRMPQTPNTSAEPTTMHLTTAIANHCQVITTWFGFRRISRGSNKVLDTVELSLPNYSYESQAVWIQVPQTVKETVESRNFSFRAGMHAASHAVLNVVPLCIICNYSDLAPECSNPYDSRSFPTRILLYDRHPGGTGVSYQVRPHFTDLLVLALEIISSCSCTGGTGCPKCVQCLSCHEYNEDLHKEAAVMIIEGVLDAENSHFKDSFKSSTMDDS